MAGDEHIIVIDTRPRAVSVQTSDIKLQTICPFFLFLTSFNSLTTSTSSNSLRLPCSLWPKSRRSSPLLAQSLPPPFKLCYPTEKREAFSVKQVERSTYLKNGPAQIIKTLRKHGKEVPTHLVKAAEDRASNTVVNAAAASGAVSANPSDQYDVSYLSPVTVGGTVLQLDFDTGSSDLWCYSSLQSRTQLSGHSYYTANPAKILSGYSWRISYGDGSSASGKVYADTVTIGGVTATSQAVEAATAISSSFSQDVDTDGLVGLAFSSINTVSPRKQTTFFDTVKSQLAKPLFAAALKYHAAGTYDFGFLDSSKYTGSITYTPVDSSQGFWGFTASAYSVGSSTTQSSIDGILDTGTTLVFLDDNIISKYYSQVKGAQNSQNAGGYIFPCSATLPNFSITVGGVKQTIPGSYINYAPNGDGTCFGGLQSNSNVGFNIFGDVFLKSKYIVFDLSTGSPRAGFAQQVGVPSS
ncbi:aspartic endopeptidase pep1 [Pyrenophora seminiperda CCB06]|uniref:Aspartic endopeptidase pep1 n=1 Tax=Pyrenophora seminiperda CCB06 TaxID=1302712 RepID=A0A3M7M2E7_9PLEO|nr:aspartic endopeptidase pep1 [Pyrenophora seminiperda CCB06]